MMICLGEEAIYLLSLFTHLGGPLDVLTEYRVLQ